MCSVKFAKNFVLGGNISLLLLGFISLVLSLILVFDVQAVKDLTIDLPSAFNLFLVSISTFLIVYSIIGIVAILRKNSCLLLIFVSFSVLLIIVQVFAVVVTFLYANEVSTFDAFDEALDGFEDRVIDETNEYALDPSNSAGWVQIQDQLQCCGVDRLSIENISDPVERQSYFDTVFTGTDLDGTGANCSDVDPNAIPQGFNFCVDALLSVFTNRDVIIGVGTVFSVIFVFQILFVFYCYKLICTKFQDGDEGGSGSPNPFYSESVSASADNVRDSVKGLFSSGNNQNKLDAAPGFSSVPSNNAGALSTSGYNEEDL